MFKNILRSPIRSPIRSVVPMYGGLSATQELIQLLFSNNEQGVFYVPQPKVDGQQLLFTDAAGTVPVTANSDPVGLMLGLSGNGNHSTQSISKERPVFLTTPDRIKLDGVDDNLLIDFGSAFTGDVFQGTPRGIIHMEVSTANGVWSLAEDPSYVPDSGDVTGLVAVEGSVDAVREQAIEEYLIDRGAGVDFAGVVIMQEWFRGRTDITKIYSGDWDTANVTTFYAFAQSCSGLTQLDVSNWDTANVNNFYAFAYACSSLTQLDVSNWNTANVTNFVYFARACSGLTQLDVSNWNTANVTTFVAFAYACSGLTQLDVSNWNTANVTNFAYFAYACSGLTTVTVNGGTGNPFADSPCTNYSSAFTSTNLTQQSIDDILVAIESAGTSDGVFDQSGGSAPSATGEAAIDALRARGWTVTVTGGYS